MRVGFGYDVHKLVAGEDFILGGVEIAFDKGLKGHSDADVLVHAIIDALLGASGLGDIGRHFPDSDEKYRGISSLELLNETIEKIANNSYRVSNIDCTVVCEKPKLREYIPVMEDNIANMLGLKESGGLVNIKATTTEGLGFMGRGDGVAAYAVCLIEKVL